MKSQQPLVCAECQNCKHFAPRESFDEGWRSAIDEGYGGCLKWMDQVFPSGSCTAFESEAQDGGQA